MTAEGTVGAPTCFIKKLCYVSSRFDHGALSGRQADGAFTNVQAARTRVKSRTGCLFASTVQLQIKRKKCNTYKKRMLDGISYHAANFEKNPTITTVGMGSRRRVAFSLLHPVYRIQ
jgi:hypothetical protein